MENISQFLQKEVLGGKFYVTTIDWLIVVVEQLLMKMVILP